MALVLSSDEIPETVVSGLAIRRTITGENLMLTRYEAKAGATFEGHSHPEEQVGYVIKGRVEFFIGEPEVRYEFTAVPFFRFEPKERHRSRALEDIMVVDIFSLPRPEYVAEAKR